MLFLVLRTGVACLSKGLQKPGWRTVTQLHSYTVGDRVGEREARSGRLRELKGGRWGRVKIVQVRCHPPRLPSIAFT